MEDFEINKKTIIIIITILILIIFSIIFSILNLANDKIIKKVEIENISVSGKTQKQAQEELNKKFEDKKEKKIVFKYKDFKKEIEYDQLGIKDGINKAVENAYSEGRGKHIIANNYYILYRKIVPKNISTEIEIDKEYLNDLIREFNLEIKDIYKNPSYSVEGDKLIIQNGKDGVKINEEELEKNIKDLVRNLSSDNNIIEIPVQKQNKADIKYEEVKKEIEKEAKDAYKDDKSVHIEENGIKIKANKEEFEKIVNNNKDKESFEVELEIIKPKKTIQDLGESAFSDLLATYTTNYDSSNINRDNNLKITAEKLNGLIINPGDEISYNRTLGRRSIENGYKEATAYAGGKVVLDVGGGICQLSTTLYNAALLANLEINERHNHGFPTSYVNPGRDATVAWGGPDLKIKNNRNYAIKLVAEAKNGVCKVDIYGIKEKGDYTVVINTKVKDIIPKKMKIVEDKNLEKGKQVVDSVGTDGCVVETKKALLRNGIVVNSEVISTDTYRPLSGITRKNTSD